MDRPTDNNGGHWDCLLSTVEPHGHTVAGPWLAHCYHSKICYDEESIERKVRDPETILSALLKLRSEASLCQMNDLCRFCMNKPTNNYLQIFSESYEASILRKMCETIMPGKVRVCDGLPGKVCSKCVSDINTCYLFMEQFKRVDCYLRTIAKYSLFIDDQEDCFTSNMEEKIYQKEFIHCIPKKAKIVPLDMIMSVPEITEIFCKDINPEKDIFSKDEGSRNQFINEANGLSEVSVELEISDMCRPVQSAVPEPVGQLLRALPLTDTELEQIVTGHQQQQETQLLCNNVLMFSGRGGEKASPLLVSESASTEDNRQLRFNLTNFGHEKLDFLNSFKNMVNTKGDTDDIRLSDEVKGQVRSLTVSYKCLECLDITDSYQCLKEHVFKTHQIGSCIDLPNTVNVTKYTCRYCSEIFQDLKKISHHLEHVHKEKNKVSCEKKKICKHCGCGFGTLEELSKHTRETHNLKCTICGKRCASYNNIKIHMQFAHKGKNKCRFCRKSFKSERKLRDHEGDHTSAPEICWVCGLELKNKRSLKVHLELHEDLTYTCEVCGMVKKTRQALSKHRIRAHLPQGKINRFLCNFCPRRFFYKQGFDLHMLTHTKNYPFKCEKCGSGYTRKRQLDDHQRSNKCGRGRGKGPNANLKYLKLNAKLMGPLEVKQVPAHECNVCGRKFIKAANLKRHRNFHFCDEGNPEIIKKLLDEPEVHKCNICGRHQFSRAALLWHNRLHTRSLKPMECEFCDMKFSQHGEYFSHERSHTGERPFKCIFCDKSYKCKLGLKNHDVRHQNESPRKCDYCEESFQESLAFHRHMNEQHTDGEKFCKSDLKGEKQKRKETDYNEQEKDQDNCTKECEISVNYLNKISENVRVEHVQELNPTYFYL